MVFEDLIFFFFLFNWDISQFHELILQLSLKTWVNSLIVYAGSILSQLLDSVNQLGAKYTVLYVSDPFKSMQYLSQRGLERFLAEGTAGNGSANSSLCDGLCQIKSSLLEGILVVSQLILSTDHPFIFFSL